MRHRWSVDDVPRMHTDSTNCRFVKQESLASTRNAIRVGREAEETARATLDKLGDQSDRFASTENHLDMSKALNSRAADETKELEALNRSIFRPSCAFLLLSDRPFPH